jgi:hypothetical protein
LTIAIVASSVTRRPLTNEALIPGLLHGPGDGLAAAVHDDDVDPDGGEEGDVVGDPRPDRPGSGSSMKLPPYFTTKVDPRKSWM